MKIKKLVNMAFLISSISLMTSCGLSEKLCRKHMKGRVEVTEDEKKILEHVRSNEISYDDLQGIPNPYWKGECTTNCCEKVEYCGVGREEIKKYIKNYRDSDWVHSSPYFDRHPTNNIDATMIDIASGHIAPGTPDPYEDSTNFDARFMDIPVEDLENYLCVIKSNPNTSNANICRFYYMRYDNDVALPEYRNKHTLAIVPVYIDTTYNVSPIEYSNPFENGNGGVLNPIYTVGINDCELSPWSNHNYLCPPFKNCVKNTIIDEIDLGH